MSELFEDSEQVEDDLEEHIAQNFEPLQTSGDGAPDIADALISDQGDVRMYGVWLFESAGHRQLLDYALQTYYSGGGDEYLSKSGIGREADIVRQTVSRYIDTLAKVGIFETEGQKRLRYRVDEDSEVLQTMAVLNQQLMERLDESDASEADN